MVCNLANQMSITDDVSVCTVFEADRSEVCRRLSSRVSFCDLGFSGIGKPIKEIFKFYSLVKREKYDVVNIHGFFYFYLFAVLMLHKKTKFVYTLHSDAYHEGTDWDNKILWIKRLFFKLKWMNAVCISNYAQKTFTELYKTHSVLIHNGITRPVISNDKSYVDSFRITKDTKVFIHPARLTIAKNQIVLCSAFSRLIRDGYDVVLLIAGANHDKNVFDTISPMLSDRIRYLGVRNDIIELLSSADGMCLPSIFEGFGLVVVEALSVGCIPICTPVGGILDIIDNKVDGLLSQSVSENDYYNTLVSFLSMPEAEKAKMRINSLAKFERFDICTTSSKYLSLYKSLLNL